MSQRSSAMGSLLARPARADLVDATGVLLLTLVGLTALNGTFDGWGFLLIAAVGGLGGILAAELVHRLAVPWPTLLLPLTGVLLLLGPPMTLRSSEVSSAPGVSSTGEMLRLLRAGWRELLTTLPPVDAAGPLTALPFTLALVAGGAGMLLARRTWRVTPPLLPPLVAGALAIALGTADPGWVLPRALGLLVILLTWVSARRRRLRVAGPGGSMRRVATAVALTSLAALAALAAAPGVAAQTSERVVWRDQVVPPVDLTDRPSPLASFRRFRPVSNTLADAELFTIEGLPAGTPVRLATLDSYSGSVWAAGAGVPRENAARRGGSGFLRVGSRIPVATVGQPVTAKVTIAEAYAAQPDLAIWLPTAGLATSVQFEGRVAASRERDLRYNPGTGAGLVVGGLSPGDTYTLSAVLPSPSTSPTRDGGSPGPATAAAEFASATSKLVSSSASTNRAASSALEQVRDVAARLRSSGAYSDGEGSESSILPGHSIGRLRAFLAEPQPAGNDEQYAATLALAAAYVGLPSRVVLAAVPDSAGVVTGGAVRAWVEVEAAAGQWVSFAPEDFVPPRDRHPTARSTVEEDRTRAAVVPPPNALRPPSALEGFELDDSTSGRQRDTVEDQGWTMPRWLVTTLTIAGIPLGAVLLWSLALVGLKAARRGARQRRGGPSARSEGAWSDIVDTLRDLGAPVSPRHTRTEVATAVGGPGLHDAAVLGDRLAFGPEGADSAGATQMWALAARVRQQRFAALRWRDRWRAAVSLRSLLPLTTASTSPAPPSVLHGQRVQGSVSTLSAPAANSSAPPTPPPTPV